MLGWGTVWQTFVWWNHQNSQVHQQRKVSIAFNYAEATFLRIIVWNCLSFGREYSLIVCLIVLNTTVKPPPQGGFTQERSTSVCLSVCLSIRSFDYLFVCRVAATTKGVGCPICFVLREIYGCGGAYSWRPWHVALVRSALSYIFHSVAEICGISLLNYRPTFIKHLLDYV